MSNLHFTSDQCFALERAIIFQFLSFEGSYKRVVNRDIAYAAGLAQRCRVLADVYSVLTDGQKLLTDSDSLHNYMYPEDH